jgi:hypothetical protein
MAHTSYSVLIHYVFSTKERQRLIRPEHHDFRTGAHSRQHAGEVADGFGFRDMDYTAGHGAIIY